MANETHDKFYTEKLEQAAVALCLRLEHDGNKTMEGADIAAIINDVAARWGLNPVDLGKAVIDAGMTGPG